MIAIAAAAPALAADPLDGTWKADTTMAAVRRIDTSTVEETDSRDGKVVTVLTMTALPGDKVVKVTRLDKLQGKTTVYTMNRL